MTSIFDNGKLSRSRGCPICGSRNTMLVHIAARQLNNRGQQEGKSVTRSYSLCTDHGEPLYLSLVEMLDNAVATSQVPA